MLRVTPNSKDAQIMKRTRHKGVGGSLLGGGLWGPHQRMPETELMPFEAFPNPF